MILNPSDRMSDTTDPTTGADGCVQLREVPEIGQHRIAAATSRFSRCAVFFFSRVALYTVSYRVP